MNLVFPIASTSKFFNIKEFGYPKHLIELMGKPIIEHVIENLTRNIKFNKIIFIVRQSECEEYNLDKTLRLLCPVECVIIKIRSETGGALCSVLLAIEHINNGMPLLISNADQIFDINISDKVQDFLQSNFDASCLTFQSVHPRWSYVLVDNAGKVIETAEKNPISKHAIAGLYMYRSGAEFVKYGMESIKRGAGPEKFFFIAPVFNEYILGGCQISHFEVKNSSYHSFYNPQKLEEYEIEFGRRQV